MGPKKKRGGGESKKSKQGNNSSSKKKDGAAQLHLSSENERRLRRLLHTTTSTSSSSSSSVPPLQKGLSELQKKQETKRLHKVYATLAEEGFSSSQIETAFRAMPLGEARLEAMLDWLCLNLPGSDLPRKFSAGCVSAANEGGSVQLLSAAKPDQSHSLAFERFEVEQTDMNVVLSRRQKSDVLEEDTKAEQADWIRRYMIQYEEEEDSGFDSESDWEIQADASARGQNIKAGHSDGQPFSIIAEFHAAKQAAADAKAKGDKDKQATLGKLIRDLKLKMGSLGLTEESLQSVPAPFSSDAEDDFKDGDKFAFSYQVTTGNQDSRAKISEGSEMRGSVQADGFDLVLDKNEKTLKEEKEEDGSILGLFDEDTQRNESLPESIMEFQRKEKAMESVAAVQTGSTWATKKASKVDSQRLPRAVLQQQCQKNNWESPKYNRIPGEANILSYTVTIVRPSVGRGKNKKVGGSVTYSFPETESVSFKSIEETQNAVATWALFSLFPDLPLYRLLPEPYRSMCLHWHIQDERADKAIVSESAHISTFVDSLVNAQMSQNENSVVNRHVEAGGACEVNDISQDACEFYNDSKSILSNIHLDVESCNLFHKFEQKFERSEYKSMLQARDALPIAKIKGNLLERISKNDVVVVSGETGCGKTTQVPQYILEEMITGKCGACCNIICTQPRRIAAISVAERVAREQCDGAPGVGQSLVGYQIRLERRCTSRTKLLFCTTGILLRRLASDRNLVGVSHVIVDEVHERSILGDFILIILKDMLQRRQTNGMPSLKVILMSATVDAKVFSCYFGNCPVVTVEGRTFPVRNLYLEDVYEILNYRLTSESPASIAYSFQATGKTKGAHHLVASSRGRSNLVQSGWGDEHLLEEELYNPLFDESLYVGYSEKTKTNLAKVNEEIIDYDLLEDLIKYIDEVGEEGAILVFLPGIAEIHQLLDRLSTSKHFAGIASEWLVPLHSTISVSDQQKAFQRPPSNIRKIVVATNIAETSITIDDIAHVVDCGKQKEVRYDPRRGMSSMVEAWISQANAKQRRGRAGRVRPGNCFCLYTRYRFEKWMRPYQIPEMLRLPLVELALQIKFLSLGDVASFLQKALEPPREDAVVSAISTLREVGALNEKDELTALGYHLARLPMDVRVGKILLYGSVLGCLSPVLTVAACLSYNKPPFSTPQDQADAVRRAKLALLECKSGILKGRCGQQSDHLAMVAAYSNWIRILRKQGSRAARKYCHSNSISIPTMSAIRDMRIQFATLLADIGFVEFKEVDKESIDQSTDDPNQPFNRNAEFPSVVKASLCAGLYPNVAAMDEGSIQAGHASALSRRTGLASSERAHWFDGRREVFIHPSSVNHNTSEFQQPFLVFHEKVETSKVYLRDTTVISPYALFLFGGTIAVQHQTGSVTIDGWLKMKAPAQTAVLFKQLRMALDSVLKELLQKPQGQVSRSAAEVIPSIVQLLIEEEKPIS